MIVSRETLSPPTEVTAAVVETLGPAKMKLLINFVEMLYDWRRITNLVSDSSFADVWRRHILDSVQIYQTSPTSNRWLDLGSGAGFPGLVLGICLFDREGAEVHCVESDGRKCSFLRLAAGKLALPVKVHHARTESPQVRGIRGIEAVTARAYASLSRILSDAHTHLESAAVAILPRGRSYMSEVEKVDLDRYSIKVHPNPRDVGGVILTIRLKGSQFYADRLNGAG